MKFLCLAYGREEDWLVLSESQRAELLAQDDMLRQRGAFISIVGDPTVVRTPAGTPHTSPGPFATAGAPLVGFSLLEAVDLDEAVRLVAHTPCAVAGGAIEVRSLPDPVPTNDAHAH